VVRTAIRDLMSGSQHSAVFPRDATHLWGKIKNDFTMT